MDEQWQAALELLRETGSYLKELREDVVERRKPKPASIWIVRFCRENSALVATLVGLLTATGGALWTVLSYASVQKGKADVERRTTIGQFAVDLSDPARRNGAAYALAIRVLVGMQPVLTQVPPNR